MSSPSFTFSSWRGKRAVSVHSQDTPGVAARDDTPTPTSAPGAPPSPGAGPGASNQQQQPTTPGAATAGDGSSGRGVLSSSHGSAPHREPIRSFINGSVRDRVAPVDSAQYARSVREDTAELASYLLSDQSSRGKTPAFLHSPRQRSNSSRPSATSVPWEVPTPLSLPDAAEPDDVEADDHPDVILETTEPSSPLEEEAGHDREREHRQSLTDPAGPSILANMLRRSPPEIPGSLADLEGGGGGQGLGERPTVFVDGRRRGSSLSEREQQQKQRTIRDDAEVEILSETTPLLGVRSHGSVRSSGSGVNGGVGDRGRRFDHESQKVLSPGGRPAGAVGKWRRRAANRVSKVVWTLRHPKRWDKRAIWDTVVVAPVACLPAVLVGLLLNILDALSYGMILFPLGNPIFANLGPAGISIFYVSTIVSQLTFSCGSVFKGGIGSELIEVVPFFHSMASTITSAVGENSPDAVIASTITAYALSSMLTGVVFYLMGFFQFGYIVGFIPRHILIGCIGGVGWFLVATGFEVSARIEGSLEYDLATLKKLIQPDTVPLWVTPLVLAIILFYGQKHNKSKYFLPLYIMAIPAVFYFFVLALDSLDPEKLRQTGWIFEGPAVDEPWWYFYTLYKFDLIRWDAIAETVPAMFALTFFGILHVPINVPALAISTGEDNVDLNHELKLHGYSNFLSGAAGSIQNYLVYANTVMFMRSGADSRLAGFQLAALTFGVMVIGPKLIGAIPVMMVGCLIFVLGFELMLEALWNPRKKLKTLEYVTVVAIVLIMGIYDFVVGIGVGILMAFVSMIFQTSQVSAVRAGWSGDIVGSTVRRNPSQQHYLQQVGRQIYIIKLAGYLFFGTIVGVEERIRALIADEAFRERPIKFLILDLRLVTGLDYSAGAAFNTISRLLERKRIQFILSGVDDKSPLSHSLRTVGLGDESATILADLNSALEACENELLKTLYAHQQAVGQGGSGHPGSRNALQTISKSLEVPGSSSNGSSGISPSLDYLASSPRRSHLFEAAAQSINAGLNQTSKWQSFREPLRLMLQIFQDLSDKNEDFWFRSVSFFSRKEFQAGEVLYRQGEPASGFYLVESGIVRMEYDLPQGYLCESIVAGTTCGELPFFSETNRTATAVVERDCVVWLIDRQSWERLREKEPDVAQELLRMGLKLTSERMSVMTSYVLTMAV